MSQTSKKVLFPALQTRLIKIASEDQKARQSPKFVANDKTFISDLLENDKRRADEVLEILEIIKTPSVNNIGLDGSRAVWLVAQHNADYKDLGKITLAKLTDLYRKDKNQVYYQGIPYLTDRLMILEQLSKGIAAKKTGELNLHVKQLYGTQYWINHEGKKMRFAVVNPKSLQNRSREFGLAD